MVFELVLYVFFLACAVAFTGELIKLLRKGREMDGDLLHGVFVSGSLFFAVLLVAACMRLVSPWPFTIVVFVWLTLVLEVWQDGKWRRPIQSWGVSVLDQIFQKDGGKQ